MSSQLNIDNVEEYLVTAVQEINPDIDLREGTAVRDLLIKAMETFISPLVEELVRIGNSQSLLNAATISESDMDELSANVFVTRRGGEKASGYARVYLSTAENSIEIPQGTFFISNTGLRYPASSRVFITRQALALNLDGSFYYMDVPIESEFIGAEYNAEAGAINNMAAPPVNFVRVSNLNKVENGVSIEDNVTLGERAAVAITVRDLVTEPGIITQLLENFTSISEIQPIGFGDVEMIRDVVTTDGTYLRIGNIDYPPASGTSIGGMVDIYIKPVSRAEEEIQVAAITQYVALREQESDDSAPSGTLQYLDEFRRPAVDIYEVEELDAVTLDPLGVFLAEGVDFQIVVENDTLTYSTREKKQLEILNPAHYGKPYMIRYLYSEDTGDAQEYVGSNVNRTVSADLLAKHAVPVFVTLDINVTQPATFTNTEEDYENDLTLFINNLELGATLEASDLVDVIYDTGNSDSRIHVELPFDMGIEEHFVDGTITPYTEQDAVMVDRTKVYIPRIINVNLTTT